MKVRELFAISVCSYAPHSLIPLLPLSLSQQVHRQRFLIRIGKDAGEPGVTSKFKHLYSTTVPREHAVYSDEQIGSALNRDPGRTHKSFGFSEAIPNR